MTSAPDTTPVSDALDELSVETRTLLGLSVPTSALEHMLPRGWSISPATQGPASGANLYIMVAERLLIQRVRGGAIADQAGNRLAVIAVPAVTDGAAGLLIIAGHSADLIGAPGYYGVFVVAEIALERQLQSRARERVEERWHIDGADGTEIRIGLAYDRGLPTRTGSRTWAYSAIDPSVRRLYVADQGTDVLQSDGIAGARLESVRVEARGAYFAALFDGSERLVSVTSLPWSVRQAFVPAVAQS